MAGKGLQALFKSTDETPEASPITTEREQLERELDQLQESGSLTEIAEVLRKLVALRHESS